MYNRHRRISTCNFFSVSTPGTLFDIVLIICKTVYFCFASKRAHKLCGPNGHCTAKDSCAYDSGVYAAVTPSNIKKNKKINNIT